MRTMDEPEGAWGILTLADPVADLVRKPGHIPLDHPAVEHARSIIPAELHAKTWIAGSAACRWPEAWDKGGDLDVWVCGLTGSPEYNLTYKALCTLTPLPEPSVDEEYATLAQLVYAQDRTHILISTSSIQEIVGEFDIVCHAAAVRLDGVEQYQHPQFSPHPVVLNWKDSTRTLIRCLKFVHRYNDGMAWHHAKTQACAIEAFGLVACTKVQAAMFVEEGL